MSRRMAAIVFTNVLFEEHGNQSVKNFVTGILSYGNVCYVTIANTNKYFEQCTKEISGLQVYHVNNTQSLEHISQHSRKALGIRNIFVPIVKKIFKYRTTASNSDVWQGLSFYNTYKMLRSVHIWMQNNRTMVNNSDRLIFIDVFGGLLLKFLKVFDPKLYRSIAERSVGYYLGTVLTQFVNNSIRAFIALPLSFLGSYRSAHSRLIITNDGTRGEDVFRKWLHFSKPILFIHNGIDDRLLNTKPIKLEKINQRIEFVVCSRLTKWKRIDRSISFAAALKKTTNIDFRLTIIGDGVEKENLLSQVEHNNLTQHVVFLGGMRYEQALNYIANSDYYLFFNDLSNLGNQVFESIIFSVIPVTLDDLSTDSLLQNGINSIKIPLLNDFPQTALQKFIEHRKVIATEVRMKNELKKTKGRIITWRQRNDIERKFIFNVD